MFILREGICYLEWGFLPHIKGHKHFKDFWDEAGTMIVGMYEEGEFAGRETEVQEMMKALNDWWREETSDHPAPTRFPIFKRQNLASFSP